MKLLVLLAALALAGCETTSDLVDDIANSELEDAGEFIVVQEYGAQIQGSTMASDISGDGSMRGCKVAKKGIIPGFVYKGTLCDVNPIDPTVP